MKAQNTLITPDIAKKMLAGNDSNRAISESTLAQYIKSMLAGEWKQNAETIKIGSSGKLLDGQHRLTAIIKSGKPMHMLVVNGVDDNVIDTIDIDKRGYGKYRLGIKKWSR